MPVNQAFTLPGIFSNFEHKADVRLGKHPALVHPVLDIQQPGKSLLLEAIYQGIDDGKLSR